MEKKQPEIMIGNLTFPRSAIDERTAEDDLTVDVREVVSEGAFVRRVKVVRKPKAAPAIPNVRKASEPTCAKKLAKNGVTIIDPGESGNGRNDRTTARRTHSGSRRTRRRHH